MHERLKKLRKSLDLTQQEFADKIGSKRNTIAKYETSANTPSTAVISLICKEFNVNEDWLRNGNGDMFLPVDRNSDIAKFTKQLLNEESNSFKNRFVSMLANLTVEEWEFLEKKATELCGVSVEKEFSDRTNEGVSSDYKVKKTSKNTPNLTREELHAALDKELDLEEEAVTKSEVLQKSG